MALVTILFNNNNNYMEKQTLYTSFFCACVSLNTSKTASWADFNEIIVSSGALENDLDSQFGAIFFGDTKFTRSSSIV